MKLLEISAMAVFLTATTISAKAPIGRSEFVENYDSSTEIIIIGTIHRPLIHHEKGRQIIHLLVSTGDHDVEVHIGPRYFLNWHHFQFEPGATVEIVASKVKGEDHYLARTVSVGGRVLVLRDKQGVAVWQ